MPENVQLAVIRLAPMAVWMSEHPGTNVDEITMHFHRTRRQMRRDTEYLAPVGGLLPGASFELDWEFYKQKQRASLRSMLDTSAPLRLSTLEVQALFIGLSAITPLLGMDFTVHVPYATFAVRALGGLKEADAERRVEAIPSLASSSESLEILRDALLREERASFTYVSASDVRTRRIVDPWSFEASASGWLSRDWCTHTGEAHSLAVISTSNVRGGGPRVREPRRMRHDAPTWTLDVDHDARWIADEYGGHIVVELDGGGARIILPVWSEQWDMSPLIDIAPHLRAATSDIRDETARRARSVLSIWTQEDAS